MVSTSPVDHPPLEHRRERFRSIFISDIHLGSPRSRAELLLDFLERSQAEFLYLVGDLVDDGSRPSSEHWPATHREVLRTMQRKAQQGTRVLYLPGNHDPRFLETWDASELVTSSELEHTTADGRRLLVMHGDRFDAVAQRMRWLGSIADALTRALERSCAALERALSFLRVRHRAGRVSLGTRLKERLKHALGYIRRFELCAVGAARTRRVDGIICGHVHTAASRTIDGLYYGNGGDWVTSCTALVEHQDGRFELVSWDARAI